MKKGFLILLMAASCVATFAQEGFHIGASGTFNSAWILNQNNYGTLAPFTNAVIRTSEMDYKLTWGGNGGLVLGYNFTRNWGLQMEVQYCVGGQKYEDAFEGPAVVDGVTYGSPSEYVNVKRNIKLGYVQIPIMGKFVSNKAHVVKAFVCFGPQFGIRTSASEEVKVAEQPYVYSDIANFTPSQKFKSFDIGLALQAGPQFYITDHLYVEVAASIYGGLADINGNVLKTLGWYSQNDVNYQKSFNFRMGLMVGVHYVIGHGRE